MGYTPYENYVQIATAPIEQFGLFQCDCLEHCIDNLIQIVSGDKIDHVFSVVDLFDLFVIIGFLDVIWCILIDSLSGSSNLFKIDDWCLVECWLYCHYFYSTVGVFPSDSVREYPNTMFGHTVVADHWSGDSTCKVSQSNYLIDCSRFCD